MSLHLYATNFFCNYSSIAVVQKKVQLQQQVLTNLTDTTLTMVFFTSDQAKFLGSQIQNKLVS